MRSKDNSPPPGPYVVGLREIPPEGLQRVFDLSGDFARATLVDTEVDADTAHITATVDLTKTGEEILVRGRLGGDLTMPCSRCVAPAAVQVSAPFAVLFLPRDADAPDTDEDADAPDVLVYDSDEIDLGDMLREELLLALPYAPLHSEDCKGLCANCGKDLNQGPCGCTEAPMDDRFAALRNLKV